MKFIKACAHSAEFLQSPAFHERVVEEDDLMLKYIPLLVQINKAGFLTNNSQAGHENYTKNASHIMERAYISGFMLESTAAEFIMYMGLYTDKNAGQLITCGDYDVFKRKLDIPLTVTKRSTGEIENFTHMAMGLPTLVYDQYRKAAKISKTERSCLFNAGTPSGNETRRDAKAYSPKC